MGRQELLPGLGNNKDGCQAYACVYVCVCVCDMCVCEPVLEHMP